MKLHNVASQATALVLLFIAASTAIIHPMRSQWCLVGCEENLADVMFAGPPANTGENYLAVSCSNVLHATSIFLCARKYCSYDEVQSGFEYTQNQCTEAGSPMPPLGVAYNYSIGDIDALKKLSYDEVKTTPSEEEVTAIVIPDEEFHELGEHTVVCICR